MSAVENTEEKRKQQPVNWQAIFRKYSWWYDKKNDRHFVVVARHYLNDFDLKAVELLEERQECPKTIPIEKMIGYFDKEQLVTVSVTGEFMDLEIVIP